MIPTRLVRTVPADTSDEVELFWQHAVDLHPGWQTRTYRDPLNPDEFPMSRGAWERCTSGAQRAGLIRLEAIHRWGGVYVDSDLELYRPLDSLLGVDMWATWEDDRTIPDFVFGARAGHWLVKELLVRAIERVGDGAWASGPGVFTELLAGRNDVLLLAPPAFAPYHYSERHRRHEDFSFQPYTFGAHHWTASWV